MKVIFGIDITADKKNETPYGDEFITKKVSKESSEELEAKQEELEQTVENSQLPLWLRITKFLCGIFAVMVIAGVFKAMSSISFEQAFKNAPALIIGGGVCAFVWLILQILSMKKEKSVLKEDDADGQVKQIENDMREIYYELGVPEDAPSVDILMFKYKVKDGEIVVKTTGLESVAYFNLETKAFVKEGMLHIADVESLYSFALDELKGIKTVNKRIGIISWNKKEDPRKGEYKKYKMTVNDMGNVFFKPYHILEIERDGQSFGLYFPCYELEVLEELTGLRAEGVENE